MAWRTPVGSGINEVWNRLCAGERAATSEHRISSKTYRCRLGAQLPQKPGTSPHSRFLKSIGISALESANEAFKPLMQTGFDKDRVGLFFSYGGLRADWDEMRNSLIEQKSDGTGCWSQGLAGLHPFWILKHLSNNAHAITARELGICGEGMTLGGLNAGAQALATAINALRIGAVDQALVVSHDSLLEPEILVALGEKRLLSPDAHPGDLCSPYSILSSGFVPGEATAAVLLERENDVKTSALAKIEAIDISDGKAVLPTGETLKAGLRRMGRKADLIDGAGIANAEWDLEEREILAEYAGPDTALTCTLSAMGQLGASSSLVQLIALIQALRSGTVHPVAGLSTPTKGPLSPIVQAFQHTHLRSGIAVSAGFPGLLGIVHVEIT
jgi:3-oxoacyl-(acyl-carrier-protein) synthase